jgi:hypothetical protein
LVFYALLPFYVDLRKEKSYSCRGDFERTEIDLAVQKLVVEWLEWEARRPRIEPLQLQCGGGSRLSLSSYSAASASSGAAVGERCGPASFSFAPRSGTRRPERPLPALPVGDEARCSSDFCLAAVGDYNFLSSPLHCAHNATMVLPLEIVTFCWT